MLTPRDHLVLRTLCLQIRVANLAQLAEAFWPDTEHPERCALARLRTLCRQGWLSSDAAQVLPLPALARPIVTWKPGAWTCDFGQLAWHLAKRWSGPQQRARIYLATPKATRIFGGRRSETLARRFQLSHDLGVAAMYFAISRDRPVAAASWIDEEHLALHRRGEKLPDAALGPDPKQPELILEFGGKYDRKRLEAFHSDCEARGLPYEIW